MLVRQYLVINGTIELHITEGIRKSILTVKVLDMTPDGIYVNRPVVDDQLFPLKIGKHFEVFFRKQDDLCSFSTSIIREIVFQQLPSLIIEHPQLINRVKIEDMPKPPMIPITVPITFQRLDKIGGEPIKPSQSGTVINMSASGVKFSAQSIMVGYLAKGTPLRLSFTLLENVSVFDLDAEVIQVERDASFPSRSTVICNFTNVYPDIGEAILVYNSRWQQLYHIEKTGDDDTKGD